MTILKLEFKAVSMVSRFRAEVHGVLTLQSDWTFLTNSTAFLQWLHPSEKQPLLVAKHVAENHDLSPTEESLPGCWWTPKRRIKFATSALLESTKQWNGSHFFKTSDWPSRPSDEAARKIQLLELDFAAQPDLEHHEQSAFTANVNNAPISSA